MNRYLIEEIQMAIKYMKKSSTSLIVKSHKINLDTIIINFFLPLTLVIFDVGEGIGWTVNYSIFREKFGNVGKNIKSVNSEQCHF